MTSRTWFWKVAVSVLALAAAWYEFYPIAPTPLEDFVPTQVIKDKPAFEKIHAEAKKRLRDYKLTPGMAYAYEPGVLHSPRRDASTTLLRIEGFNLGSYKRHKYVAV